MDDRRPADAAHRGRAAERPTREQVAPQAAPAEHVGIACPSCGASNDPDAACCEECGAALTGGSSCGACGARNEADAAFCEDCGAAVRAAQGAASAVANAPAMAEAVRTAPVAPPPRAAVEDRTAIARALNASLSQYYAKAESAKPAPPRALIDDAAREAVAAHQSRKFSVHPDELARIAALFQRERRAAELRVSGAVELQIKIRLWKCNYQELLHNSPGCCSHPEMGGVWVNVCEDDLVPASER